MKKILVSVMFLSSIMTHASFEHAYAKRQVRIVKGIALGEDYSRKDARCAAEFVIKYYEQLKDLGLLTELNETMEEAGVTQKLLQDPVTRKNLKQTIRWNMKLWAGSALFSAALCTVSLKIFSAAGYGEIELLPFLLLIYSGYASLISVGCLLANSEEYVKLPETQQRKLDNVQDILKNLTAIA